MSNDDTRAGAIPWAVITPVALELLSQCLKNRSRAELRGEFGNCSQRSRVRFGRALRRRMGMKRRDWYADGYGDRIVDGVLAEARMMSADDIDDFLDEAADE